MVNNHLKRLAVPKTWDIKKKGRVFVARPHPGGHKAEYSVPLIVLFRDMMKRAKTVSEMKYILHNKEVLRNGVKLTDHKAPIGLLDVISIPELKEHNRVVFSTRGKLKSIQIDDKEAKLLPSMIINKTSLKGGKTQINFSNGYNIIVEKDSYKTGDVLVIDLSAKKVAKHLKLAKGAQIYLIGGKHIGVTGTLEDIKGNKILFKHGKEVFETDRDYAFVVGKEKPVIKLDD
jgi:small subunit ribosomal protein S4e